jgi:hypothetical protein
MSSDNYAVMTWKSTNIGVRMFVVYEHLRLDGIECMLTPWGHAFAVSFPLLGCIVISNSRISLSTWCYIMVRHIIYIRKPPKKSQMAKVKAS